MRITLYTGTFEPVRAWGGPIREMRSFEEASGVEADNQITMAVLEASTIHNTWAPPEEMQAQVFSTGVTITIQAIAVEFLESLFKAAMEGIRANVDENRPMLPCAGSM